jgi:hypothetical protein
MGYKYKEEMVFQKPRRIAKLLKAYRGTWAIAGGWAIDLFLNKETRKHSDIEVVILRAEQIKFKRYLSSYQFKSVQAGSLCDWTDEERLALPIHEIHGYNKEGETIEVLLNEVQDGKWQFRRNPAITYPKEQFILKSQLGIPIVSPEVVLLYKAKMNLEKDLLDLQISLPSLELRKIKWLKQAIELTHGNHPWLKKINTYTDYNILQADN